MSKKKIDIKLEENIQVTTCTDIDEGSEGSHTCHPSATCRNTLGGLVLFLVSFFTLGGFVLVFLFYTRRVSSPQHMNSPPFSLMQVHLHLSHLTGPTAMLHLLPA